MFQVKRNLLVVLLILFSFTSILILYGCGSEEQLSPPNPPHPKHRTHLDHSAFFKGKKFNTPQEVTKACLECHKDAAKEVMQTSHWQWLGKKVEIPGHDGLKMRIGKKNVINNFCISIVGNWHACTKCHAGYGWKDKGFDFTKEENIDCLICHDWSGSYVKGKAGIPPEKIDLAAAAGSVGYPKRENCNLCHSYGGGGHAVKHGDLDTSLNNAPNYIDAHLGKHDMQCIDCHSKTHHKISGTGYGVSVNHDHGFDCSNCHTNHPHKDPRLNAHTSAVACQTCHIPHYAKQFATKMWWDWSKAGDPNRKQNPHEYLKIKGEFKYDAWLIPEYRWFNLKMSRYILGDKIDPNGVTDINTPLGDINDPNAKIWPFKIHRALQPYDKEYNYLLVPRTAGEGGYWHDFDWDKACRLGARDVGIKYSGKYGFTRTDMYWPLSHMVAPADQALKCSDCHGPNGRMDWKALGYESDPMYSGGRNK